LLTNLSVNCLRPLFMMALTRLRLKQVPPE
jgi:hypothetical protein